MLTYEQILKKMEGYGSGDYDNETIALHLSTFVNLIDVSQPPENEDNNLIVEFSKPLTVEEAWSLGNFTDYPTEIEADQTIFYLSMDDFMNH
jgi:hypothetical protein